jgi:4-hydroxythreonine-4-phosphate dehydrogenase
VGDPAGIGPDITISAWKSRNLHGLPSFFAIAPAAVFEARAAQLGLSSRVPVAVIASPDEAESVFPHALPVLACGLPDVEVEPGHPNSRLAPVILKSIEEAVKLALEGSASGVVTNPIAKHVLMKQGFAHAGHTEFLGELSVRHGRSCSRPVMLMASEPLMTVPVTVHIPLKEVAPRLTSALIIETAEITIQDLSRYFGLKSPRLAVCGLNPHAGESGELGREEIDIIAPAIAELKARGRVVSGPHPADTLFHLEARQSYDAVLAMYHDQALIPFKTLAFENGVNVTLGLPFIRTSPDHGTAFSLAGTGRASPISLIEAIKLAARMDGNRQASAAAVSP